MRILFVAMATLLLVTGCSRTNLAEVVKAFAQDRNAWCARDNLGTVYGTNTGFIGRGSVDTTVELTADGCRITGANVNPIQVPLNISPRVTQ